MQESAKNEAKMCTRINECQIAEAKKGFDKMLKLILHDPRVSIKFSTKNDGSKRWTMGRNWNDFVVKGRDDDKLEVNGMKSTKNQQKKNEKWGKLDEIILHNTTTFDFDTMLLIMVHF